MTRQEFKKKAKENIDSLFQQVDQLEEKAMEVKGDAKDRIQVKLKALREQKEDLNEKLNNLEESTEENWTRMVNAFSNGLESFKKTLHSN